MYVHNYVFVRMQIMGMHTLPLYIRTCSQRNVNKGVCLFVCWSLNVPETCKCISGTDLHRQFTCCHCEMEVADPTVHLTQSQYTDTVPANPRTGPITPGAWQGNHWNANLSHWYDSTRKNPAVSGIRTRIFRSRGGLRNQ